MRNTNTLLCLDNIKLIFSSIALKQSKTRPQSSGIPALVFMFFIVTSIYLYQSLPLSLTVN